ncbi:MAG: DUF4440 domain-containing protein [bacterium]
MTQHPHLDAWISAIQSHNPDTVLSLYDPEAVLLPTVSNQIRFTQEERRDYFLHFLAKKPQCKVVSVHSQSLSTDREAIGGIYHFSFADGTEAKARYSFVFDSDGLIYHHHSSLLPE